MREKILIVGLGYVGRYLGLAFSLKNINFDVLDLDIESKKKFLDFAYSNKFNKFKNNINYFSNIKSINNKYDILIICLPTPKKGNSPDLSYIIGIRKNFKNLLKKSSTIILESTVYPGTTRNIIYNYFKKSFSNLKICYSSERVNPGDSIYTYISTTKVISGINKISLNKIKIFYKRIFKKLYLTNSLEEEEASKLVENTFRSINISLINELKMILDQCNINIWNVINASSSKEFGYMRFTPSIGFGGHCIPVDPVYFNWFFKTKINKKSKLITLSNSINNELINYIITKIEKNSKNKTKKILIAGIAYKSNIDDIRESRSISIAKKLKNKKYRLFFYDSKINYIKDKKIFDDNYSINLRKNMNFDAIIICHKFKKDKLNRIVSLGKIIFDSTNSLEVDNKNVYLI